MVMLQPKLSLKPTTAFELQNIGLFAISHPLLCFFGAILAQSVGFEQREGR